MRFHPNLFELQGFIGGGAESADFEAHVSACTRCRAELSRLARRALSRQGLLQEVAVPRQSVMPVAAFIALAASLAVLLVRAPLPSGGAHPEGQYGVPATLSEVPASPLLGARDAGGLDSGTP